MTIHPPQLLGRIPTENRGGLILRRLCAYHPTPVSMTDLMAGAGLYPNVMGPVSANASFYWWIHRINDDLASYGWQAKDVGGRKYKLEEAS